MEAYLNVLATVIAKTASDNIDELDAALKMLLGAERVFVIGNGGSLTTAAHFALDLTKYARKPDVEALTSPEILSALANDLDYGAVFSAWLQHRAISRGDVLVAFTYSGTSRNIENALGHAHRSGARSLLVTGSRTVTRAAQSGLASATIFVPSLSIRMVEDVHLAIAHALAEAVKG